MGSLRSRCAVGLCACLLGLSLGNSAAAQPAASPLAEDATKSARAKELYLEGVKAASRGKWEQARALFLEAYRLKPHFQIAINLGQAELKVGQYRDAAEHLSSFLKEAQGISEDERKKATDMLAEARAHVGMLHVRVDRAGAEVLVDGAPVGKSPLQEGVFVEPGQRAIEARMEGYAPAEVTREVLVGGEVKLDLRLEKLPEKVVAPQPPPTAAPLPPPAGGPNKVIVIGGAAAAGGLTGVGVGFLIGWKTQPGARAGKLCTDPCTTFKNLTFWSLLSAGLVGGATLTYTLVTSKSTPKKAPMATLVARPDGGAVMVTGVLVGAGWLVFVQENGLCMTDNDCISHLCKTNKCAACINDFDCPAPNGQCDLFSATCKIKSGGFCNANNPATTPCITGTTCKGFPPKCQ